MLKTWANVPPLFRSGLFQTPEGLPGAPDVVLWVVLSCWTQVTLVPMMTLRVSSVKFTILD